MNGFANPDAPAYLGGADITGYCWNRGEQENMRHRSAFRTLELVANFLPLTYWVSKQSNNVLYKHVMNLVIS
jgi:hypothetical protein